MCGSNPVLYSGGALVLVMIGGAFFMVGRLMIRQGIGARLREGGQLAIASFRSDNLWFNPTGYLRSESLNFRICGDNSRLYWVDRSSLPILVS